MSRLEQLYKLQGKTFRAKDFAIEDASGSRHNNKAPNMPVIAHGDWNWNIDSFFFTFRGRKEALLTAVEMTSRRIFIDLYGRPAPNGDVVRTALRKLQEKYPVRGIQADLGTEFKNDVIQKWCERQKPPIPFYFTQAGVKKEASLVESMNSSFREFLMKFIAAERRRGDTNPDWKAQVPGIVEVMNNRINRTINMAPASVREEDMGLIRVILKSRGDEYLEKLGEFKPGDSVLVWSQTDPNLTASELSKKEFDKGRHTWMDDVYTIVEQKGYKFIVSLGDTVFERRISPRDLRKIDASRMPARATKLSEEDIAAEKEMRVERKLRKEGIRKAEPLVLKERAAKKEAEAQKAKEAEEARQKEEQKALERAKPRKARNLKQIQVQGEYEVDKVNGWKIIAKYDDRDSDEDILYFKVKYKHQGFFAWQPFSNFYTKNEDGSFTVNKIIADFVQNHKLIKDDDGNETPLQDTVDQFLR